MVLPVRPQGNSHLWTCLPVHLLRNAVFLGCGDRLGSGLGGVVAGGCPSAWGALANGMDQSDDDDCPNKMW